MIISCPRDSFLPICCKLSVSYSFRHRPSPSPPLFQSASFSLLQSPLYHQALLAWNTGYALWLPFVLLECCIYHKARKWDESSDDSGEDESDACSCHQAKNTGSFDKWWSLYGFGSLVKLCVPSFLLWCENCNCHLWFIHGDVFSVPIGVTLFVCELSTLDFKCTPMCQGLLPIQPPMFASTPHDTKTQELVGKHNPLVDCNSSATSMGH